MILRFDNHKQVASDQIQGIQKWTSKEVDHNRADKVDG